MVRRKFIQHTLLNGVTVGHARGVRCEDCAPLSRESVEVNEERSVARSVLGMALVFAVVYCLFVFVLPAVAHAQTTEPGPVTWTFDSGEFTVTRHGVVLSSTLPHCAGEDGATEVNYPCTWNIGARDGNGRGTAYIVLPTDNPREQTLYYVWNHKPTGEGWRWEGGPRSHSDCVVKWFRAHWTERCPDGTRTRA